MFSGGSTVCVSKTSCLELFQKYRSQHRLQHQMFKEHSAVDKIQLTKKDKSDVEDKMNEQSRSIEGDNGSSESSYYQVNTELTENDKSEVKDEMNDQSWSIADNGSAESSYHQENTEFLPIERGLRCLGKGFDVPCDFRAKYCKGKERLVVINEEERGELAVPGFGSVSDVSVDVKCDKGDRMRYQSDVLEFSRVVHPLKDPMVKKYCVYVQIHTEELFESAGNLYEKSLK